MEKEIRLIKNTPIKLVEEENSSDVTNLENDKEEETTEQTPKIFDEGQSINKEATFVLENKEDEKPLILNQEIAEDIKD